MDIGEIWGVDFPFDDDSSQSKIRPCLILDVETLEVLSLKVTTHVARDEYDIPIFKWRDANLPKPSFARTSKAVSLPKKSFLKKYGKIDDMDFGNIIEAYMKFNT